MGRGRKEGGEEGGEGKEGGGLSGHEAAEKMSEALGLDGKGGLGGDAGVSRRLFGGGGGRLFGLSDDGLGEGMGVARADELSQGADGPGLGDSVELGGKNRTARSVGLEHDGGKSFRGNLGMHEAVEGGMKRDRIGLLSNEAGPVLQTEVADIIPKKRVHRARAGQEESSVGEEAHDNLGGLQKNSLTFPHGKIKSADDAKNELVGMKV